jgi:bifunctional UDP-N-acetylglucosamine pyrophosphorylase/glucosamine-1-phosphate N-acetyltransferase
MKAIILAAGKSRRMRSHTHKALHRILGKPLLLYVTDACREAGIEDVTVVIGPDGGSLREALPASVRCVIQEEALGTGHAVMAARDADFIDPKDDVLVMYGDMPLITAAFLRKLAVYHRQHNTDAVVTSVSMDTPYGYGRVFASEGSRFIKIVEQSDLSLEEEAINAVNTGVYTFKGEALFLGLDGINQNNKQQEYYLTDVPAVLRGAGRNVLVYRAQEDSSVFAGINTQTQLTEAALYMRRRVNLRHMENGVHILDPESVYIDCDVYIAPEAVIYPGVFLEGASRVEKEAVIGPNTRLINSTVGEKSTVQYSVLKEAVVGNFTDVGPFAYLRPGAVIGDHCRVGDFVEVKNSTLGNYSKASHLAYIGDADVGSRVNFGCGAITANYDGTHKNRVSIGDGAFVGSNSNLVAPVTLGEGSYVAAGSTITEAVPPSALAIARQRQTNKLNWRKKS